MATMTHNFGVVLTPEQRWYCPDCDQTAVTHSVTPTVRTHPCEAHHGIEMPFVQNTTITITA